MNNMEILTTKLKMPLPRRDYVIRAQLFEKLETILDYKLILVEGSAGSGKTTLVSSYLMDKKAMQPRWLSLDPQNNSIYSFWSYFLEAVIHDIEMTAEELRKFFDIMVPNEDIQNLLIVLINQLSTEQQLVIVLDDFQYLHDKALLESIEYFIKNSAESIHFVVIAREKPELYVGDLLIHGKFLEIDENDMKFSKEEGIRFLKETLKIPYEMPVLEQMYKLSEGWIGGLQMLALAAISNSEVSISSMKYLNKHSIEYLSKEILGALSEEERSFLIKTAILSYFDADLCNQLLGIKNAQSLIHGFYEKNLFVIRMDEEREIYRYHGIFGEFLKGRFSTLNEQERTRLHRDAGHIFTSSGDYDEGIRQYLSIGSFSEALATIRMMEYAYKGWSYLSKIPMEYYIEDLDLLMQRLFYLYFNNDFEELRQLITFCGERAEDDKVLRVIQMSKSMLLDLELETDLMTMEEIESISVSDTTKATMYIKLAAFLHMQHRFRDALSYLEKAEVLEKRIDNPFVKLSVLGIRSAAYEELGDLLACDRIYDEIFHMASQNKLFSNYTMNLYVGVTGVYLKTGRLEKAEEALELALANCNKVNMYSDAGYLYNLMELKLLRGQKDAGYEIIKSLMDTDVYKNMLFSSSLVKYLIHVGELSMESAHQYLVTYKEYDPKYLRIEDRLAYARVLHFIGRSEEARVIVDDILQYARCNKTKVKLVEALLFKIRMLGADEKISKREQLHLIREAVYYSYENQILSPYLLEGQWIMKHVTAVADEKGNDLNPGEKVFIRHLSSYFKSDKEDGLLSDRELEVLKELATGASNKEIGGSLCISVATVKTHIINIYSKLQVGNRVEAVEKARGLRLI